MQGNSIFFIRALTCDPKQYLNHSNLEDKVLIEEGRTFMNINKMEDPCGSMSNYIWNPGKMPNT